MDNSLRMQIPNIKGFKFDKSKINATVPFITNAFLKKFIHLKIYALYKNRPKRPLNN